MHYSYIKSSVDEIFKKHSFLDTFSQILKGKDFQETLYDVPLAPLSANSSTCTFKKICIDPKHYFNDNDYMELAFKPVLKNSLALHAYFARQIEFGQLVDNIFSSEHVITATNEYLTAWFKWHQTMDLELHLDIKIEQIVAKVYTLLRPGDRILEYSFDSIKYPHVATLMAKLIDADIEIELERQKAWLYADMPMVIRRIHTKEGNEYQSSTPLMYVTKIKSHNCDCTSPEIQNPNNSLASYADAELLRLWEATMYKSLTLNIIGQTSEEFPNFFKLVRALEPIYGARVYQDFFPNSYLKIVYTSRRTPVWWNRALKAGVIYFSSEKNPIRWRTICKESRVMDQNTETLLWQNITVPFIILDRINHIPKVNEFLQIGRLLIFSSKFLIDDAVLNNADDGKFWMHTDREQMIRKRSPDIDQFFTYKMIHLNLRSSSFGLHLAIHNLSHFLILKKIIVENRDATAKDPQLQNSLKIDCNFLSSKQGIDLVLTIFPWQTVGKGDLLAIRLSTGKKLICTKLQNTAILNGNEMTSLLVTRV